MVTWPPSNTLSHNAMACNKITRQQVMSDMVGSVQACCPACAGWCVKHAINAGPSRSHGTHRLRMADSAVLTHNQVSTGFLENAALLVQYHARSDGLT